MVLFGLMYFRFQGVLWMGIIYFLKLNGLRQALLTFQRSFLMLVFVRYLSRMEMGQKKYYI